MDDLAVSDEESNDIDRWAKAEIFARGMPPPIEGPVNDRPWRIENEQFPVLTIPQFFLGLELSLRCGKLRRSVN
jgi:hypothetical protein